MPSDALIDELREIGGDIATLELRITQLGARYRRVLDGLKPSSDTSDEDDDIRRLLRSYEEYVTDHHTGKIDEADLDLARGRLQHELAIRHERRIKQDIDLQNIP
jgi:hypothetical protein